MLKRIVAAPLWFVSVWCMVELVLYFVGGPRMLGPLVGIVATGAVLADPWSRVWKTHPTDASASRPRGASPAGAPERIAAL